MNLSDIKKYLDRYAEATPSTLASADCAVVIPLCDETYSVVERLLNSLARAALKAQTSVLAILIINSEDRHSESIQGQNQQLLKQLGFGTVNHSRQLTLQILDRTSAGLRIPNREGVGHARKVGSDLALRLLVEGKITNPLIRNTDGDVEVAEDYFVPCPTKTIGGIESSAPAGFLYEFEHIFDLNSPAEQKALLYYELRIRYYQQQLKRIASPYAFITLGSTIAFNAGDYARVRGYPRREAGEDFYLLNKLAQLGSIQKMQAAPVHIHQRPSHRTPFGTGAAMRQIENKLKTEPFKIYHPTAFDLLGSWLKELNEFAQHRDLDKIKNKLRSRHPLLLATLEKQKISLALTVALKSRNTPEQLKRHMLGWFDGLKHLQFMHLMRDSGLADIDYRHALSTGLGIEGSDEQLLNQLRTCRQLA